jgi:predicted nucleic acid-binding protein
VIHLDTSFLIHALAKGTLEDRRLRSWLAAARPLAISSPAWAEFLCGPVEDDHVTLALRVLGTPLPSRTPTRARPPGCSTRADGVAAACRTA